MVIEENPVSRHAFDTIQLTIQETLNFEKEDMLSQIVAASGLTPEEFSALYVIEEYPLEILKSDDSWLRETKFSIRQDFKVRLKTEEEQLRGLGMIHHVDPGDEATLKSSVRS